MMPRARPAVGPASLLGARSIAAEIGGEIHEKLAGRLWHKIGLGIFWFYLLLTAAILTRARRRAAAEKDR